MNPIFYACFVRIVPSLQARPAQAAASVQSAALPTIFPLQNGRPLWGGSCTCMACICRCPAEAIEYGRKSRGKPRYHFEAL